MRISYCNFPISIPEECWVSACFIIVCGLLWVIINVHSFTKSIRTLDIVICFRSVHTPRIQDYIENVVDNYSDEQFRENFRMFRTTFDYILGLIRDKISTGVLDVGRHTITPKAQLMVAVWYFSTPDSYRYYYYYLLLLLLLLIGFILYLSIELYF